MYNLRYYSENGRIVNFSPKLGFVISSVDGLTSVNVEMSLSQGMTQIGKTIHGVSVQDKTLVIEGSMLGRSKDFRKQLIDAIVPGIPGRLVFNGELFLDVEPEVTPDITRHAQGAKFQFSVRAGYPYWRSLRQSSLMLAGLEPLFMFPVNYGDPSAPDFHMFGRRVIESYRNAQNLGNVPVPFLVKFHAVTALANPQVLNIETLEFVRVEKEMVAGETVIVDMTRPTLEVTSIDESGAASNAFAYFDISSTMPFFLRQGDNLLRYEADEGRSALECTVYHHFTTAGAYGPDNVYV